MASTDDMDSVHSSRPGTLLSAIHAVTTTLSTYTPELHPFADSHDNKNAVLPQLSDILSTTSLVSIALSSHSSLPISDPKLVSLMRQHAALTQELNTVSLALLSSSRRYM
jgi:hypothetical protein